MRLRTRLPLLTYLHINYAVVLCGLCALPGFAAPRGCCCLTPVRVPWLWPAACLSGVPCGPALVRRASSGPVALSAPVGFLDAVVLFPIPGPCAPGFTRRLRGACGGRPRTRLLVPAAGRCRGSGAVLAPRRTRSGPRDGVLSGGSLQPRSGGACAALVCCVWTQSLRRLVSRAARLSTGDSAGAAGLFCVDADDAPFGWEEGTPGSHVCVRVRGSLGRVGRAGFWGAVWCASPFPVARLGVLFVSLALSLFLLCSPQRRSLPGPAPAVPLPPFSVTLLVLLLTRFCMILPYPAQLPTKNSKIGSFTQIPIPCNNQLPSTIQSNTKIHTEGFQECVRSRVDTQQLLSIRQSSHGAHGDTGVGHVHRIAPIE